MPTEAGTTWTIVVAAGSGSRFGGDTPKQFLEIAGKRVVDWSVSAAASVSDGVVVVVPKGSSVTVPAAGLRCQVVCVNGGDSRSESVRKGLAQVPDTAQVVLVHDAARPVASAALMATVVAAVRNGADAAIPVVGVVDTIRDLEGNIIDRSQLQAVQTPQGFSARALRDAHASGAHATDDATLVSAVGGLIVVVPGERWNIKVTEPDDLRVVAALLGERL
ncbi:MAG: 2-C-methyl-D-erythritol 4-phosphate cytidylyltransferase [Acidimicrobiales bacterium]|jgi:2-C-methyl-D-erythritol 4-phosphate cytidylyltransferase